MIVRHNTATTIRVVFEKVNGNEIIPVLDTDTSMLGSAICLVRKPNGDVVPFSLNQSELSKRVITYVEMGDAELGVFDLEMLATDFNQLGTGGEIIIAPTVLIGYDAFVRVRVPFEVINQTNYDEIFGADGLVGKSGAVAAVAEAGLSTVTTAQVKTQCTSALTDYDAATGADITTALGGVSVTIQSPVDTQQNVTVYKGDDYTSSELTWTLTGYTGPSLSGCTAVLKIIDTGDYEAGATAKVMQDTVTVSQLSTTVTITASLSATDKANIDTVPHGQVNNYRYQIIATTAAPSSKVVTLVSGYMTVEASIV